MKNQKFCNQCLTSTFYFLVIFKYHPLLVLFWILSLSLNMLRNNPFPWVPLRSGKQGSCTGWSIREGEIGGIMCLRMGVAALLLPNILIFLQFPSQCRTLVLNAHFPARTRGCTMWICELRLHAFGTWSCWAGEPLIMMGIWRILRIWGRRILTVTKEQFVNCTGNRGSF